MAALITAFIYKLLSAIPPAVLLAAGGFFMIGGAAYFVAGLRMDDHQKGKKNCWTGFLYAVAGAIFALFPDYPILVMLAVFIIVLMLIFAIFGWLWGFILA